VRQSSWRNFHVSESDRGVPGTGQVDWKGAFRALKEMKYQRWLTIESFGQTVPEIAAAAAIWRPLFKSNEEVAKQGIKVHPADAQEPKLAKSGGPCSSGRGPGVLEI
jgi:sugar phosphate isomerase/epimerase